MNRRIETCDACPRLREHCATIARVKRRAYANWTYWGRPVANFGDSRAELLIVGLAPAAHGANRTGRMFTGDRSGDWLYRALHRSGFANQALATDRDDGLELSNCAITAVAHCAPPANKPTSDEMKSCANWLSQTFDLLPARVFVALGQIAWRAIAVTARENGWLSGRLPKFGHGRQVPLDEQRWLLGSYHPSQQNTFTGRLTESMLDDVFRDARRLLAAPAAHRSSDR